MKISVKVLKSIAEDEMATATYQLLCEFEDELKREIQNLAYDDIFKFEYKSLNEIVESNIDNYDDIASLSYELGKKQALKEILGEEASE